MALKTLGPINIIPTSEESVVILTDFNQGESALLHVFSCEMRSEISEADADANWNSRN